MGENQWRGQRQPTAVVVQIVRVLVVADQYPVYRSKSIGAHRGTGDLSQVGVWAGRIEGRVHYDPAASDVDDRLRAAQHANRAVASSCIHCRTHVITHTLRVLSFQYGSRS
jgi:hypothetical protein